MNQLHCNVFVVSFKNFGLVEKAVVLLLGKGILACHYILCLLIKPIFEAHRPKQVDYVLCCH